jgi:hypothetical protein
MPAQQLPASSNAHAGLKGNYVFPVRQHPCSQNYPQRFVAISSFRKEYVT